MLGAGENIRTIISLLTFNQIKSFSISQFVTRIWSQQLSIIINCQLVLPNYTQVNFNCNLKTKTFQNKVKNTKLIVVSAGGSRLGHSGDGAGQDVPLGLRGSRRGGEHHDPDGVPLPV